MTRQVAAYTWRGGYPGIQSVYGGNRVLGLMKVISQRSVEDHDPVLRGQPVSHPISLLRYRIVAEKQEWFYVEWFRETQSVVEGVDVVSLWKV